MNRAPAVGSDGVATDLLAALPLLHDLPRPVLRRLAAVASEVRVLAGSTVFGEDDLGRDLYVVLHGRLEVLSAERGGRIAWIGPHEVVGERAVLDGGRRCATIRAARDTTLVRIPGSALERLFTSHPVVLRRLSTTVADRVRVRRAAPAPGATTITVVATGATERWLVHAFCQELSEHLRTAGPTAVVERGAPDGAGSIDAVEASHRFVIREGAGARAEWTRRCVREADVVLLLADASADPQPTHDEQRLLKTALRPGARCELVLRHAADAPTGGTGRWLEGRRVDGWHHVTSRPSSMARIGRHVRGDATGLVLGGGGARGLAHLGVLRALEQHGTAIDAVGGTSIGAIMGAFAALGWDHEHRMAIAEASFVRTRRLVGYTLPLLSLSSSKKLTRLLQRYVGEVTIEDLPVPFFCVSANYSTGDLVVHDRGPLWWALRASISLPGILPPVFADGHLLVDGGVLNNLPVDVMRERGVGSVVAVDLRSKPSTHAVPHFEPTTSGWRVLAQRVHPGRPSLRLPGPAATMLRAKELGGKEAHRSRRAAADILLEPPVGGVDSMDFKAALPLADSAYRYALTALA